MESLRTPDEHFANLPGYTFAPHYIQVGNEAEGNEAEGNEAAGGAPLRMHYVDEGPREAAPVLLLHGEPSWSYLYRKMIPGLVAAGHRVIAPDLIGFGRSDKPTAREDYTYARHVDWMRALLLGLDLHGITLFCQDWGGLIGLRLAAEHKDRFARIVASNTSLPTGDTHPGRAFLAWQRFSQESPDFRPGSIVQTATVTQLPDDVVAAYDAPFPDDRYLAGARQFPLLVPTSPDDPAAPANRRAWEVLGRRQKPFLCAFGDSDPITGAAFPVLQRAIPGAAGQPHQMLSGGGHFIQEDKGEELARIVVDFIAAKPSTGG
ncbi:MAG TPA: haloalkane dehalogenase [Ktedonobacterales bacterium]